MGRIYNIGGIMYPIGWGLNAWEHWAVNEGSVYWNGRRECVALVETWIHNLRAPVIPCEYAAQMYTNAQPAYWQKIPNTPNLIPKAGDIACFHEFTAAGHVCVVRNSLSTVNYLYTIDQNWSREDRVSYETHHYTAEHIQGFLRRR